MESHRRHIDDIDSQIVALLARRMEVVRQIGALKRQSGRAVADPGRETQLKSRLAQLAADHDLDPGLVLRLYELILNASRDLQS